MTFRGAERLREPAEPMRPVVDPAGWYPADLAANDDWIYELSAPEITELRAAVADVEARGLDIWRVRPGDFSTPRLDDGLAALYDEVLNGRGFVLIRGVPIADFTKTQAAIAFWGIGTRFGRALSQNPKGHMLGHVKDFGADYNDPNVRGYQTRAEMTFHGDQCDYVALVCIHPAKSGGGSRIASAITLYNEMVKSCPDLVEELTAEYYFSRHGEIPPGEKPWYKLPIFSFHQGYLSVRAPGAHVMKSQGLPGVPPFTEKQLAAITAFRETVKGIYFEMDFRPGDIQILHNHLMLHTRSEFVDWPELERKRHLMRLWLSDDKGRPLVPGFRERLQGIEVAGMAPTAPVDSFEPA